MNRQIASFVLALTAAAAPLPAWATALRFKRIMTMDHSAKGVGTFGYLPIADLDRDGCLEMVYRTGGVYPPGNYQRWEIGRFEPHRRWRVLFSDTCPFPPPNGIHRSYFVPGDIADYDRDGRYEVLGHNWEFVDDSINPALFVALEQRYETALPDTMVWMCRISTYGDVYGPAYAPGSLDGDIFGDSPQVVEADSFHVMFECDGDNRYTARWVARQYMTDACLAFCDLNADGLAEMLGGLPRVWDKAVLWESTGDDQYAKIWQDSLSLSNSGHDCFSGHDVDGNARPELYMAFYRYIAVYPPAWMCYLYQWESDGAGGYVRRFIDSLQSSAASPAGRSICADLDGDGLDEIAWSTNRVVTFYSADSLTGIGRVGWWWNDHSADPWDIRLNAADVDRNGYLDVVAAGNDKVTVLSVEAIRLTTPNTGTFSPGDTVRVGWQLYRPPRCDSVSLFLRRDSTWRLDTIARGLPPVDSSFVWTVPNVRVDSGWLMAMAYGPGWQYDETDNPIRITGSGAVEERPVEVYHTGLRAEPNPCAGRCRVGYEVARRGPVRLALVDAAGREAATLASGPHEPGRHWATLGSARERLPAGVYFLRLEADGTRLVQKVVVR